MRSRGIAALGLVCACAQAEIANVQPTSTLGDSASDAGTGTGSGDDGPVGGDGQSSATMSTTADATDDGITTDPTSDESTSGEAETSADAEESSETGLPPPPPSCGDGQTDADEACDDGNDSDTDACLSNCQAASCGDGIVQAGVEACDNGTNDGAYGGCNPGCGSLAPHCGDGVVQPGTEHCDGSSGFASVGCDGCLYDFSGITQLYCNGTCTWAGNQDCDQADADIYCKLVTGNPNSVANSFLLNVASDQPGFSCPSYGTNLGSLPAFGVNVDVWYQDSSILATHGAGIVVTQVSCS
jgi:cysteine-rich repeat protein